jgi:hypothetical protein
MSGKTIDVSHLAQAWVHSHEEDTATTTVYRPAKFPFPPSRGRKGFRLLPDGTMSTRRPGPTDQTERGTGTWKLVGDQLELSPDGEEPEVLCIELVEPDRLVVQNSSTCQRK